MSIKESVVKKNVKLFFILILATLSITVFAEETNQKFPCLNSITFIGDEKKIGEPSSTESGIFLRDLTLCEKEDFICTMKKFLDKPITMDLLGQIKKETVEYYYNDGQPLVYVSIPADQDICDGNLKVIVLISKLGDIKVEGAKHVSKKKLIKEISTKKGQVICTSTLRDDIEWINTNPFRSVQAIYEEGKDLGTTDIVLHVNDRIPIRIYGGYEFSSYKTAGYSRYKAGLNLGNIFKLGHQLDGEFTTAAHTNDWWCVNGNYIIPLPWRHTTKFYGAYIHSLPSKQELEIESELNKKNIGKFWQIGYRYNWIFKRICSYFHQFILGIDFKRTNNFTDYNETVYENFIDIFEIIARYEGDKQDSMGSTNFGFSLYYNPGHVTRYDKTRYYQQEREGAHCKFIYGIFNLDRVTRFCHDFSWISSFSFQFSSTKLVPLEEYSLGGHLTVRGYLENEAVGDLGLLFKNEIRTPPVPLHHNKNDHLQFLAFVDFGYLTDVDKSVISSDNPLLLSVGPGIRYKMSDKIDFRFDYGFQLKSVYDSLFGKNIHSFGHIGAYLSF